MRVGRIRRPNDRLFTCWGIEGAGIIRPASANQSATAVCRLWKRVIGGSQAHSPGNRRRSRNGAQATASAFNDRETLLAAMKFFVPGNGNEQHDVDGHSAI